MAGTKIASVESRSADRSGSPAARAFGPPRYGLRVPAPPPLPLPPAESRDNFDPLVEHTDGLWTIHAEDDPLLARTSGRTPSARFDAPAADYAVLYLSSRRHGAWGEVFGDTGQIELHHDRPGEIKWLSVFTVHRPLRLVALDEPRAQKGLRRGLDNRICNGDDYETCQAWSAELHRAYPDADGIRYFSRQNGAEVKSACSLIAAGMR
jgi:RES domain